VCHRTHAPEGCACHTHELSMYGKNALSTTAPLKVAPNVGPRAHASARIFSLPSRVFCDPATFSLSDTMCSISFLAVLQELASRSFMDRETIVVHHQHGTSSNLDTSKRLSNSCGSADVQASQKPSCLLHCTRTWKPATKLTSQPLPFPACCMRPMLNTRPLLASPLLTSS
jgi:hypothetical protein